jgi:hypothetical protein
MEISNEIKAKVISQYLGQTCQTMTRQSQGQGLPFKFIKGELKEIDLGMIDDFIGLLLENETNVTNHTNYNTDQCKLILKPLSAITDEDVIELYKIMVGDDFDERYIETFKKGEGVKIDNIMKNVIAYQWLQSKGYDLPQYLLGGKTLQEAGLAVYETN